MIAPLQRSRIYFSLRFYLLLHLPRLRLIFDRPHDHPGRTLLPAKNPAIILVLTPHAMWRTTMFLLVDGERRKHSYVLYTLRKSAFVGMKHQDLAIRQPIENAPCTLQTRCATYTSLFAHHVYSLSFVARHPPPLLSLCLDITL